MSEEKEQKKPPLFFIFKGQSVALKANSIKKFERNDYYNGSTTVYCIHLYHFDMDDTVIEYTEEDIRDAEYLNLIDKLKELGVEFM